jgi:hypothetical protein
MVIAKMKHNWDLFSPLICAVMNIFASKGNKINQDDIHPFRKKKNTVIPFNQKLWKEIIKDLK